MAASSYWEGPPVAAGFILTYSAKWCYCETENSRRAFEANCYDLGIILYFLTRSIVPVRRYCWTRVLPVEYFIPR